MLSLTRSPIGQAPQLTFAKTESLEQSAPISTSILTPSPVGQAPQLTFTNTESLEQGASTYSHHLSSLGHGHEPTLTLNAPGQAPPTYAH